MSRLGRVEGIRRSSASCFRRSMAVVWTLGARVRTSQMGSQRLVLTVPWTQSMVGDEGWRRLGGWGWEVGVGELGVGRCGWEVGVGKL